MSKQQAAGQECLIANLNADVAVMRGQRDRAQDELKEQQSRCEEMCGASTRRLHKENNALVARVLVLEALNSAAGARIVQLEALLYGQQIEQ